MMSNFGGKSRTAITVTTTLVLVAVLALAIASMGLLLSAHPLTRSASAATDNYLVDEIFPKPTNVQHLYNAITGKTNATYADVVSAATQVTNSAQIRSYNNGNDIKVTFGGQVWDVVYLSTTNDNRPILTLWLSNAFTTSKWNTYLADGNTNYPSDLYGTSYIRALLNNGGTYATSGTKLDGIYAPKANYALQEFLPDGKYGDLVVTPSYVAWQEGNGVKSNRSNTFYGIDAVYQYEQRNYAKYRANGDAWKNDNLWLPSTYYETFAARRNGTHYIGSNIWEVSNNQLKYNNTIWGRDGDHYLEDGVLRGRYNITNVALSDNSADDLVTAVYSVRPALHLDLAALNRKVTTDLPDITVDYDGINHQIANMIPQPEWYTDTTKITYTKGGQSVTEIKDAGEYNAKIELGVHVYDFKITITPREITYNGELSVVEKTYDATTRATVTGATTLNDLIENDDVQLSINANFLTKDVGTNKTVVATITLKGKDAANYTLTNGGSKELKGNINVCTVVVNGIKAKDKEYDNTNKATLDLTTCYLSLTGDMINDDVTVAATGTFRQVTIGENLMIDLLVGLDGADAHNYTIGGNTQLIAYGSIKPRVIAVKINKVRSAINAELAELTATIQTGSLATGDTLNEVITLSTDADYAVLGEYTITGECINENYTVTFINDGIYEVYDPALEPEPEPATAATEDSNLWLVIFCAGGVTAILLILIILIAIIKHQRRLAKEKARQQKSATKDKKD